MKELQIGLIHFLFLGSVDVDKFRVSHYKATNTSMSVELIEIAWLQGCRLPVRTYYVADRNGGERVRVMSNLDTADVVITNL